MKQALNLCSVVARILLKPSKENFNIPSQNNRRSGTRVCVWSHKFFCELYLCATTSHGPQICCYGIGKGRNTPGRPRHRDPDAESDDSPVELDLLRRNGPPGALEALCG